MTKLLLVVFFVAPFLIQATIAQSTYTDSDFEYVEVEWGDSVSKIAEHYGISQSELIRLNNLTSTRIMLGDKLKVPSLDMVAVEARAKAEIQGNLDEQPMTVSLLTLQEGDSLSNIATAYGLSLSELMELNNLSSTRIQFGQQIIVSKALLEAEDVQLLTVAEGQGLSDIAAAHGISTRTLMFLNGLSSARISEGQPLIVATGIDKSLFQTAASETDGLVSASSQGAADLLLQSELETVVVQARDTLEGIAAEFGQTVEAIIMLNHLTSETVKVGDVLMISANRALEIDGEAQYFTVRRGDSLGGIANRYNTSVNALVRANKLSGHRIFAGDKLRLPYNVNGDVIEAVDVEEKTPETYTVRSGDTLYKIAYNYDLSIDALIASNELYGSTIHPGQVLQLVGTADSPAPEPLIYAVRKGDTLSAIAKRFDVTIDEISAFNKISPVGILSIGNELRIPEHFAQELIVNAGQVDRGSSADSTYVVQKGDTLIRISNRFSTPVESIAVVNRIRGSNIRAGQVLQIPNAGDVLAATTASAVQSSGVSKMSWPLKGAITSDFGFRSLVVAGKNRRNHTGMDIDGHTGDLIYSAIDGTVTFSGWQGGYGNLVVVTNGNMDTYYAHASELLVQKGETVSAGQKVARVGTTGLVTGSHLHFEVRINGVAQNPAFFLN